MRKLFDIRFSYKHCNFSRVTLQDRIENRDKVYFTPHCLHNVLVFLLNVNIQQKAYNSLEQGCYVHLNAQRSKAMSQFLDGCAPIPPHPAASPPRPVSQGPRGHTQSIVSSSFSVSFTSRYRKISQLSSQSRVEL